MDKQIAIKTMLGILSFVVLFHFLILFKIIPYSITWGGKLKNDSEMYVFESISIVINAMLMIALLIKGKLINYQMNHKIINGILWFFLVVFLLNTIGNLFANTSIEKLFSILTLLFVCLLWVILKKKRD